MRSSITYQNSKINIRGTDYEDMEWIKLAPNCIELDFATHVLNTLIQFSSFIFYIVYTVFFHKQNENVSFDTNYLVTSKIVTEWCM